MKSAMIIASMTAILTGCAFNPESMPVGQRDSSVYVDEGAPEVLSKKENRAKVAVMASVGEYKDYKKVGEALDSSLNAKLAGFAFFQVVDRKSTADLINNAMASGVDPAEAVKGVEANFVVIARLASLSVKETSTKNGTFYSTDAMFDFKWISTASQRVVMTESIKPTVPSASSKADIAAALGRSAEDAVKEFCAKIAVKYAPPARVLETRGDGAAARISIGQNYGVSENTEVCFYEIVDNSDVGGEKRDMKDIATGNVKRVEEKSAWVKVKNPETTNVRKGVYVRVLGLGKGSLLDMPGEILGN